MQQIESTTEGEVLKSQWDKDVKSGTKNNLVAFYRKVLQATTSSVDESKSGGYIFLLLCHHTHLFT